MTEVIVNIPNGNANAVQSGDDGTTTSNPGGLDVRNHSSAFQRRHTGLKFNFDTPGEVPQGTTIISSCVILTNSNASLKILECTIYGNDVDSSQDFEPIVGDNTVFGRTRTTASVSIVEDAGGLDGIVGSTTDIKTIIQEIVDRPSWDESSISLMLIAGNTSSNRMLSYSYSQDVSKDPYLIISYSSGSTSGSTILSSCDITTSYSDSINSMLNIQSQTSLDILSEQNVGSTLGILSSGEFGSLNLIDLVGLINIVSEFDSILKTENELFSLKKIYGELNINGRESFNINSIVNILSNFDAISKNEMSFSSNSIINSNFENSIVTALSNNSIIKILSNSDLVVSINNYFNSSDINYVESSVDLTGEISNIFNPTNKILSNTDFSNSLLSLINSINNIKSFLETVEIVEVIVNPKLKIDSSLGILGNVVSELESKNVSISDVYFSGRMSNVSNSLISILSNIEIENESKLEQNAKLIISAVEILYGLGIISPVAKSGIFYNLPVPLDRTYLILKNKSEFFIEKEDRNLTINKNDNIIIIDKEGRIFIIPIQNRKMFFPKN